MDVQNAAELDRSNVSSQERIYRRYQAGEISHEEYRHAMMVLGAMRMRYSASAKDSRNARRGEAVNPRNPNF